MMDETLKGDASLVILRALVSASYNRYANGAYVPVLKRGSKNLGRFISEVPQALVSLRHYPV